MDSYFDEVKVYKLVPDIQESCMEYIEGYSSLSIQYVFAKKIGSNGIMNTDVLDQTLEALIYFSDTQFAVPKVYRWAKSNNVYFLPYIGVVESHSENQLIGAITNILFKRNIKIYKKCYCLAKTLDVEKKLRQFGVSNSRVASVGIDTSLLKNDYKRYGKNELKEKFGYKRTNKVILFIGRMVKEKRPERMVSIFADLVKMNESYRLLMVGTGSLEKEIIKLAKLKRIFDKIQLINHISNSNIWQLYRIADVFINLNPVEIFGMALLEAMYYECKVVAWRAPGPDYIVENGVSGWLVESDDAVIKRIMDSRELGVNAHHRVVMEFTWRRTADKINEVLNNILIK